MKKYLLFCIALVCLLACKKGKEEIPVESVVIVQPAAEIIEGETIQLTATVKPDDATDKTVEWASSKQSVATITDKGLVSAIAPGSSTITATAGGKTAACRITVSKKVIEVTSVALNKEALELVEGEAETLIATVKPDDATDKTVEWSTSAPQIVTVNDGKITGLKEGKATITAKAGDKEATCQVTVNKRFIPVESITLDKATLELTEGEEGTITATVKPDDATDKTVSWSSSAPEIAAVENGKITALKEGKATITAKAGDKEATCEVTVNKRFIPVESITLDKATLELTEGEEGAITATVKPDDATDKTVEWSSSAPQIVTVNDGKITALKEGKATITAKAGEKTATCEVTVNKRFIPVESITLDKTAVTMLEDESTVLTATVKPDYATDKTVTWSSSDKGVATVEAGRVTSVKEGKAIVTARAGDKEATCEVIVSKRFVEVTSITLNLTEIALVKGEEQVLTATVKPDDATDKSVAWSSGDAQVAKVDNKGKVTALKSGTATITATAGKMTAECRVTVSTPVEDISLDRTALTLEEGQSESLTATVIPEDADEKTVAWSSSNADIAKVDDAGKVTAVKAGSAVITAKAGEQSATCSVTVEKKVIPVTSVTLNTTNLFLKKGQSETLTVTVQPADATDKAVSWSSSDEKVATVQDGTVTAVKSGTATITAMAGDQKANCTVTVTNPVTSITLDQTLLTLDAGEWVTLTATVTPDDADDKTVNWSSTDASIVTVDNTGKVTAVAAGTATITAKAGDKTATCWVNVEAPPVSHTRITYQEAEGEVLNPERGMYSTFEIHKASYSLSASSVKAKVASGHTVQLLEFYLTDYMDRNISQDYLDMIQQCFDAMRGGGAKAIVRFAYKDSESSTPWDPEVDQVLSHVKQLKPILQRNEDVLFVLQAGFIGVWGEWYYTTHFIMSPKTDDDYAPRKQLTEALLDAVPASRQIQLRTPQFKMRMYKLSLSDTLRAATAHNGSALSRLGGHNDCFGATSSDMGTFQGDTDRRFWKADTRYTIMGGETCQVSDYCLCPQSLKDLEDYHWTYLHDGYNRDVLKRWERDGCMDEIKARLGYRLVLQEVEYDSPRAGQPFKVTIRLKNKGYAAPMNPRQAYLVWKNAGGAIQKVPLGSDPRTWHPGNTEVTVSFTPQSGKGTLYLELSDPLLPNNPAYSIALANQGVFDAQTGYNLLFQVE